MGQGRGLCCGALRREAWRLGCWGRWHGQEQFHAVLTLLFIIIIINFLKNNLSISCCAQGLLLCTALHSAVAPGRFRGTIRSVRPGWAACRVNAAPAVLSCHSGPLLWALPPPHISWSSMPSTGLILPLHSEAQDPGVGSTQRLRNSTSGPGEGARQFSSFPAREGCGFDPRLCKHDNNHSIQGEGSFL